jgi:D-lactate dehydrogenase (cytochrome)
MQCISGKNTIKEKCPEILYDESRFTLGIPEKIYFPENREDIVEIVELADKTATPVISIGSQTSITGASTPEDNCFAVSFIKMDKILSIQKTDNNECLLTCQPGVTLKEIDAFLEAPVNWKHKVEGAELIESDYWFYPPDPTELTATLAGTVATNASGARSFYYKPTRDYIVSISIVLADGETFTCRRGCNFFNNKEVCFKTDKGKSIRIEKCKYTNTNIKNAAGYYSKNNMDLIDLFIGSEGTLGIFFEITIKLLKRPQIIAGLTFFPERKDAFGFADFVRKEENVLAIEYFDRSAVNLLYVNREHHKIPDLPRGKTFAVYWEYAENTENPFEEIMEEWENKLSEFGTSFDYTWSGFEKKEMEILKSFRHLIPELINNKIAQIKKQYPEVRKVSTDTALPAHSFNSVFENYIDLIEKQSINYICFGHLGDYHLHLNLIPANKEELKNALDVYKKIMELTVNAGGTVSAEHGIGKIKKDYLHMMYRNNEIAEMKKVKSILDSKNLLNSGNLF